MFILFNVAFTFFAFQFMDMKTLKSRLKMILNRFALLSFQKNITVLIKIAVIINFLFQLFFFCSLDVFLTDKCQLGRMTSRKFKLNYNEGHVTH